MPHEFRMFFASPQDLIPVIWAHKRPDLMAKPMRVSDPGPAYRMLRASIRRACVGRDQEFSWNRTFIASADAPPPGSRGRHDSGSVSIPPGRRRPPSSPTCSRARRTA